MNDFFLAVGFIVSGLFVILLAFAIIVFILKFVGDVRDYLSNHKQLKKDYETLKLEYKEKHGDWVRQRILTEQLEKELKSLSPYRGEQNEKD